MTKVTLKYLCEFYFIYFAMKDLEKLSFVFADDIELIDWDIHSIGKSEVLKSISNIFKNTGQIQIVLSDNNLFEEDYTVCCEIKIKITNKETNEVEILNVVDILTFDNFFKIKKISAYKR